MTVLKGGDLLVDAVAAASARLGTPDPAAPHRRRSAASCMGGASNSAEAFRVASPGWLNGDERWRALAEATLLAIPSSWPEPFGLVGLEAGALGIPAVAFDVGGIREWLRPASTAFSRPPIRPARRRSPTRSSTPWATKADSRPWERRGAGRA